MGGLALPLSWPPRTVFVTRAIYGLVIFVLVGSLAFGAEELSRAKNQGLEQDTISAGQDALQTQLEAKILIFSSKITAAAKLGIDVTPFQAQLAAIKKLVFIDRQFTKANQFLTTQGAILDALIEVQTGANALAQAAKDKGNITGLVKDGATLLAGVKVSLSQGGNVIGSANSDASGVYALGLKFGTYQLTASKSGYNTLTQKSVTLTMGQTLTNNLVLTKAVAAAPVSGSSGGATNGDSAYEVKTVNGFSVSVATFNLASGQFRVATDTANDTDCLDNCPTKSLSSYVSDNGGFAGMNGTYFCPTDYASCAGKTGSYYWKVWNSRLNKMINGDTNSFVYEPFLTVTGNTAKYFDRWIDFSGSTNAGISSSPALISGGHNVLDQSKLDDKQRSTKSNRGGVGLKGQVLYLIIAKSATVIDLGNVMQGLGLDYGMNLDGGGSSAMIYNGSYKVGPGRAIPNAIVVARR